MAERDVSRPASLPIRPTAVVATVDVARPLRADAMTTAVLQDRNAPIRDVTPVFAYASSLDAAPAPTVKAPSRPPVIKASLSSFDGIPLPVANPLRVVDEVPAPQPIATGSIAPLTTMGADMASNELTLTALDTLGLRQWIGSQSTRQKPYAMLTMPDFGSDPSLLDKPRLVYSVGFGYGPAQELRTDSFSGSSVQMPTMIDLTPRARLAFR
jgi:hypothetical protein